MKELDGRKLDHKTLEAIRIRAVKRVEAGESPEVVIKALGFSRTKIYEWISRYRCGGEDALKAKPLFGRPPKLNGWQLEWIYKTICDKNPLQLKFEFALWTREMVGSLIEKEFEVKLSPVSVGRLLRSLGLSPQRPVRKAYQRDEDKVEKWLKEEYPEIRKLAEKEGAAIYFGDEAGVRSDYHSGTTWAPVGKTPTVETTGARFGINVISAISPKGHLRFMVIKDKMNSDRFCEFLKRLIYNSANPLFLIVDNHPAHRSSKVKRFVEEQKGKLRLFALPSYSPDLNPDELVWNNLKNHGIGRKEIAGPDDLKKKVISILRSLQKVPDKIMGFFRHPKLQYISA